MAKIGSLAQLVERHVYTVDVIGSIPVGPTYKSRTVTGGMGFSFISILSAHHGYIVECSQQLFKDCRMLFLSNPNA